MATTPSGIAYDHVGPEEDIAVVLVHAGVADRRMWDPQWPALGSGRHAVRLDLRGFGESTVPPRESLSHVEDLVSTLAHLGIRRCHLVGSSLGAGVAVEAALTAPRLVRSLVLCPPGGSLLATTPDLAAFIEAEESALLAGDVEAAVEANVACWAVGAGRVASQLDRGFLDLVRRMQGRAFEVTATWEDLDEVELQPPASERLPDVTAPVLVLVGGHDLDTTRDAADRLCAGLARVRRVDWPDVAHLPSLEQPDRFLALLLGWLAEHGG